MPRVIYSEASFDNMTSCIAEEDGQVKRAGGSDCWRLFEALKEKYGKPTKELSEGAAMAPATYVAIWEE